MKNPDASRRKDAAFIQPRVPLADSLHPGLRDAAPLALWMSRFNRPMTGSKWLATPFVSHWARKTGKGTPFGYFGKPEREKGVSEREKGVPFPNYGKPESKKGTPFWDFGKPEWKKEGTFFGSGGRFPGRKDAFLG